MKRLIALALALGAATVPALAQPGDEDQRLKTGYWEMHTVWLGFLTSDDKWCVRPRDIQRLLGGISNHNYTCVYPINQSDGGQILFDGVCTDKSGSRIKLHGSGAYTPISIHMKASGHGNFHGFPVAGGASGEGRFISSECPPGAKTFSR